MSAIIPSLIDLELTYLFYAIFKAHNHQQQYLVQLKEHYDNEITHNQQPYPKSVSQKIWNWIAKILPI